MTLATATADGVPSARIVLLKALRRARVRLLHRLPQPEGCRARGESPGGAGASTGASWSGRCGSPATVTRTSPEESETYFRSRPLGSRLGAWASHQSQVIAGRAALEADLHEIEARFADGDVPLPPHWGGYRVKPGRDRVLAGAGEPAARSDPVRAPA